jgi:hypothetical protein
MNDARTQGPPSTYPATPKNPDRPARVQVSGETGLYLMALIGLSLIYLSLWWNRYLGLSLEGWFLDYGRQIARGAVPYRDFYLFVPPLHALKAGLLDGLFSGNLAAVRAYGALERLGVGVVCFYWLRGLFGARTALIALVPALFCFSADNSDILFYYQQDATGEAILGAFALTLAVDRQGPKAAALALLSGVALGMALATRQTVGLVASVAALALLGYFAAVCRARWKAFVGLAAALLVGLGLVLAPMVLWLAGAGALKAFVTQVFIDGPSSKGAIGEVLLRPLTGNFASAPVRLDSVVALAALLGLMTLWRLPGLAGKPGHGDSGRPGAGPAMIAVGFGLAMVAGVLLALPPLPLFGHYDGALRHIRLIAVDFGFFGAVAVLPVLAVRGVITPPRGQDRRRLVAFGLAAAATYGAALSYPSYEPMILPAFPLMVGLILSSPASPLDHGLALTPSLKALVLSGLALTLVATITAAKLRGPYNWAEFAQPPTFSPRGGTDIPELRGLDLPRRTAADIQHIVRIIQTQTKPTDPIFVTPDLPLLYLLSNRRAATFAPVDYIDVAPDAIVRADIARLAADPPKVIVAVRQPDALLARHEGEFRGGKVSGQRALVQALGDLQPRYDLAYTAPFEGPPTLPIDVWVRRP